jgi:hypothetical protein
MPMKKGSHAPNVQQHTVLPFKSKREPSSLITQKVQSPKVGIVMYLSAITLPDGAQNTTSM